MKNIYLISGLGADERAFQRLSIPAYKLIFIDWIIPAKNEKISEYAQRLLPQIHEANPIIIGLSFGGMVALEIAKLLEPEVLFLISSARSRSDLHPKFPLLIQSKILHVIPKFMFRKSNRLLEYLMGVKAVEDKQILTEIIADTDTPFLFWALKAMSEWENNKLPKHLVEIHGTTDKLIPFRRTERMEEIKSGGHLMILNKAEVISSIVLSYLSCK